MIHPSDFFDLSTPDVAIFFEGCDFVWQAIKLIKAHVAQLVGDKQVILGEVMSGAYLGDRPIFIDKGARIEPGAYVHGPAYIGAGAVVRHGAFVRENVIMLPNSISGPCQ